ncbi:universal stress protein [Oxalobacteraceae bacterium R-40]|uniref:Universal stress protein n=1 Tax=Keguizhuia sedimenti TaxID=3064264 RepID=A0ABU1BTH8_9BURK|nr:universal stress protein [Oxalobacteraceae bacterium R-40]
MKILLAADGSSYTTKAAEYLIAHFDWFKESPELHVIHVKLPIPIPEGRAAAVVGRDAVENYYREEAGAALAPAETILKKHGIPFKGGYLIGDIAQQLNAYAKENGIEMIVMGTHGHGALKNLVMGSVATKVLAVTSVPVLLIR